MQVNEVAGWIFVLSIVFVCIPLIMPLLILAAAAGCLYVACKIIGAILG